MHATKFKRLRKKLGLSLRGMAERLGVTHPCIAHWENGRRPIPKMAEKLLAVIEKNSIVALDRSVNRVDTSPSRSHVAKDATNTANGKTR